MNKIDHEGKTFIYLSLEEFQKVAELIPSDPAPAEITLRGGCYCISFKTLNRPKWVAKL